MANILPFETQKKIWGMYRARFLIAASLVSLTLSALAGLALVPSYLALQLAAPPAAEAVAHSAGNVPDDIATVTRTQALITALTPIISATTTPSESILVALGLRPQGVTVTHITYTAKPSLITLGGAASRTTINAYRDALAHDVHFTNVSIPVDALIGNSESFTVSLKGNF
ncbi:MAG: hypothetical protein JWM46_233 [Candidatus Kaiserbacteria bacterium]|nr:hypothetical protein [Candidatus Kaiserbacteria bacterium]